MRAIWPDGKPLIGVVHLHALPDSPGYEGNLARIRDAALTDLDALTAGGVDGVIVENFGDSPFHPGAVPPATVAHMTALTREVVARTGLPVGVNVLRNDGVAALAVAQATGARFIRVNVLTGARLADQGIVHGIAHRLLRERRRLGADGIAILADVDVKHSAPLAPVSIDDEVRDTVERGRADAIIVSGSGTGRATDPMQVVSAKVTAGDTPVLLGSGVNEESSPGLLSQADGWIVGTALKRGGRVHEPVDADRVARIAERLRSAR
jgi:membrane complex biogenesis BtpA family protein